ncbi:MAG: LLM class flavin-dependent oxidoreductase [Candidatus Helarchaeales archaeon]
MIKFSIHQATNFSNLNFGREEVLKSARLCEELGCFDMNTIMCHLNWYPKTAEIYASWIMASEIALSLEKTQVGIMVTDVFRTHPAQIALNALHLQRICRGGFNLGLGAGEGANLLDFGIDHKFAVSRLEEAVQVVRLLLNSSPKNKASFEGRFFKLNKVFLQFAVKQPPRIWLAAGSPRTLKLTGEHADGWIPIGYTPELYREHCKMVNQAGRNVEKGLNIFIALSKKEPEKARELARMLGSVLCLRPEILKDHVDEFPKKLDFIEHFKLPLKKQASHAAKAIDFAQKNVPPEVIDSMVLSGTPENVIESIEKWEKAGCENLFLQFIGDDYWGSMRLFAEEVAPHFR